jgi:hypothetical protein
MDRLGFQPSPEGFPKSGGMNFFELTLRLKGCRLGFSGPVLAHLDGFLGALAGADAARHTFGGINHMPLF